MAFTELSYLSGGQGTVYYSPIRDQGYCLNDLNKPQYDHPALNTFNACTLQTRQVHNYAQNQDFVYYHADGNLPACNQKVDMKVCGNYDFNNADIVNTCNDYFSNFDPESLPLSNKRQQYVDKVEELAERTAIFNNLLDGGNTSGLLNTVINATETEAITALQNAGSYVSDTVLIAAINRLGSAQGVALQQILIDNSKLSPKVWNAVVNFTPHIFYRIYDGSHGCSRRRFGSRLIH